MAERKKTEYYSDELLAAVEQLRDGGNPHDIADRLNSLAVDMRNFAIVSYPQLSDDLQICLDILKKFMSSDGCNRVSEGYALVVFDLIIQIAEQLELNKVTISKFGAGK